MASTFKRELARFDSDRVLPAWDGLLAKQQNTLESLGVPTMFSTTAKADREVGHLVFLPGIHYLVVPPGLRFDLRY